MHCATPSLLLLYWETGIFPFPVRFRRLSRGLSLSLPTTTNFDPCSSSSSSASSSSLRRRSVLLAASRSRRSKHVNQARTGLLFPQFSSAQSRAEREPPTGQGSSGLPFLSTMSTVHMRKDSARNPNSETLCICGRTHETRARAVHMAN